MYIFIALESKSSETRKELWWYSEVKKMLHVALLTLNKAETLAITTVTKSFKELKLSLLMP